MTVDLAAWMDRAIEAVDRAEVRLVRRRRLVYLLSACNAT